MKVFLDTNVLVSAAATRGLCSDVLREVFASHDLFISEQVLSELKRVLRSKFGIGENLTDDLIWLLRQDTILAQPARLPRVDLQDKDDLHMLGAAIAAGASTVPQPLTRSTRLRLCPPATRARSPCWSMTARGARTLGA